MDIQALRYAVTLAEELHFRKAAERHYIAPQAFGRHVRALEKEIGARLFDRTSRRVTLTPAGVRLVDRAREVLASVDDARRRGRRSAARMPTPSARRRARVRRWPTGGRTCGS